MLPEYRDMIAKLRQHPEHKHFANIFDKHNALDEEINNLENNPVTAVSAVAEIETKKKEKLALKDEIFQYIKQVEAKGGL